MHLSLHRLWAFVQVVENGGFSAAAEKLYMSQPSISNHVRQLEASLHTTLIDRTGSRIRPTVEGEVLLGYAKRLFALSEEAATAVASVGNLESGKVTVGGTTTIGTYFLPSVMAQFRGLYPAVELNVVVGNGKEISRALLDGELGLAVMAGAPSSAQLAHEQILTEQLILICHPDSDLLGRRVTRDDLLGTTFILREPGSETRARQESALEHWDLSTIERAELWGLETAKRGVMAGLGISLISEHAVDLELSNGQLGVVDIHSPFEARPVVVSARRDRLLPPAEKALLKILRGLGEWPGALTLGD